MPKKQPELSIDEVFKWLDTASGREKQRLLGKLSFSMDGDPRVRKIIGKDIQSNIEKIKIRPVCPNCGSTIIIKKGFKNNRLQRFQCTDCNRKFTSVTGTLLEKTKVSWGVWVEIIRHMLLELSIEKSKDLLSEEYGLKSIEESTIHNIRMKVMNAAIYVPMPELVGVIETDETSFHEAQKGRAILIDPIDPTTTRDARKRAEPSAYGSMGPEFGTALCAVDHTGHVVIKFKGVGATTVEEFEELIGPYIKKAGFLCSDANVIYSSYCTKHNIRHYVRPSKYIETVKKAKKNKNSLELLYKAEMLDYIDGEKPEKLPFSEFKKVKETNNLSLSAVNGLHSRLKSSLKTDKHGVNIKNLDKYLAWMCLLENYRVDHGSAPVTWEDAENILVELIKVKQNITLEEIRNSRPDFTTLDQNFQKRLIERTKAVSKKKFNARVYITTEDYSVNFNVRNYLEKLPVYMIVFLARRLDIKGRSHIKKDQTWAARKAMEKHPDIMDAIDDLVARYGVGKED